jgi:26S proteasome regulatory subunit N8
MPGELSTTKVIIHPLVLLSVVDHYTRMSKIGNQKRVVGVLLGCWRQKGVLDVSNSFAGELRNKICLIGC